MASLSARTIRCPACGIFRGLVTITIHALDDEVLCGLTELVDSVGLVVRGHDLSLPCRAEVLASIVESVAIDMDDRAAMNCGHYERVTRARAQEIVTDKSHTHTYTHARAHTHTHFI